MLYHQTQDYLQQVFNAQKNMDTERQGHLQKIADYINTLEQVNLIFICTHNSRRSHFAQIWAEVASSYYSLSQISTYSGGTEVTAMNERVVSALKSAGMKIEGQSITNPRYLIKYADAHPAICAFSKTYDHFTNPQSDFIAIMTCSDADENCPVIPGVAQRFALTYQDPKVADGSSLEEQTYNERCLQIAGEIFYLLSNVKRI